MKFRVSGSIFMLLAAGLTFSSGHATADDTASMSSLVKSATGYEMPQERVSTDITVITREDISHLPVHDLGEALTYVNGLNVDRGGGPGTPLFPSIQGSDYRHVKILIDDIPIETLSEGFPDLSLLPLENVQRIEILKGSASSVWGSALGGVINVITRQPSETTQAEGSISIGENSTRQYNSSVSGKVADMGYFLSASRFETDGFFDFERARNDYFYTKLTKEITPKLKAEASYGYTGIDREDSGWIATELTFENHGRVMLTYTPDKDLDLSVSVFDRQYDSRLIDIATDTDNYRDKENIYGGTFRSVWRHSTDGTFSLGAEASHGRLEWTTIDTANYDTDKRAVFANEGLGIGNLSLNAGVRYDNDYAFGSEVSPSAGVAYKMANDTFIRINAARGFTPPPITFKYIGIYPNNDLHSERAWMYQAGVETGAIPGMWGKVTFYRADVTDLVKTVFDVSDVNGNGNVHEPLNIENLRNVRRQGVEVEAKTREYKGLTLSYSYAYNDVRDLDSDDIIEGQVRVTHNVGIDYKGPFETRTTINGHYVYWNAPAGWAAKDKTFVWGAKVSKYLTKWKYAVGEVFMAVHNITDQSQYWASIYPNPPRWVEAGVNITSF